VSKQFSHEPDSRRYVLREGNELVAILDYAINGGSISFTRTFTSPAKRGKGFAGEVVEYAVNDVESSTNYRIVPMCWYVDEWFQKHPERANLLTR
jgi:uncharacterized protein